MSLEIAYVEMTPGGMTPDHVVEFSWLSGVIQCDFLISSVATVIRERTVAPTLSCRWT